MPLHGNNGKVNTTTVTGSSKVNLYDTGGGINVVIDDAVNKGIYHPSGALRVNSGTSSSYYDASGAVYSNHVLGPGK